jgi:FtsH-binding integral membrane protein
MASPGAQPIEISSEAKFFQNVYLWMLAGLMVTTFSTYLIFGSDLMFAMLRSKVNCIIVFVVQIGLVMLINFLSEKVSTNVLRGLFLLYAASVGLTISILLLLYPQNVIFKAFLSAAFVYGGMAAYGMYTKKSLEKWGSFLFMALLGLIVSMVINLFARSPMAHYVISWFGVIIFALLTSYDHQKLRVIHAGGFNGEAEEGAMVIHGALTLYLDFINIFIFLVRILGASRD